MSRRYFITAGHGGGDPGAVGNGFKEADLVRELRDLIADLLRLAGHTVFTDDDTLRLPQVVAWLHANVKPDDVLLDLHFNAAASSSATGTETLVPAAPSTVELKLAAAVQAATVRVLKLRDRNIKTEAQSHHGKLAVMRPNCHNLLLEVAFISSPKDVQVYQANKGALANAISQALILP